MVKHWIIKTVRFCFSWKGVGTAALGITLIVGVVLMSNWWVKQSSEDHLYTQVNDVPSNNVGLVLGTAKYNGWGGINPFFKYRMEAAADLYKAGKIQHILVSGDNHVKSYDESSDMKDYLIDLGVPADRITLDYAGFRTLDSMVRAKKVFGQQSVTVISQRFHNERAVFIGRHYGMNVIGFNARDVHASKSKKVLVREVGAKFKAVLDLYLLGTAPKFLGEPVHIPNHLAVQ